MVNFTCNSTMDNMRIVSESPIAGSLNFHQLGIIVSAACALIAVLLSFYLIFMHAINYTKPYEQRHIIRILFMVPVYATASFLSFWFYWRSIYFGVMRDCYEAFAIASFFALLCHYIAPNLHDQKQYFRSIKPKGWVLPLNWFRACCGGDRGPWRTPRSGLTWFNVIWFGIYQYCFIRVAMTITAVVTQYFDRYCEASMSPVFSHVWVMVIEALAVTVAMYCVIQFYVQTRFDLAPHSPFLKVLAIKLVIFLSFWQTLAIDALTSSTINVLAPSDRLAYPDIKVGIPNLLLTIEMAFFAVLHLFAFPYRPYVQDRHKTSKYPNPSTDPSELDLNTIGPKQGGFLGAKAILDAMNPWDLVKAFGRGMRWIFVGRKHRENDISYKIDSNDMDLEPSRMNNDSSYKPSTALPIAEEFRRSKFGLPTHDEEGAGLIAHAQPNPLVSPNPSSGQYKPARERYDPVTGQEISSGGRSYDYNQNQYSAPPHPGRQVPFGMQSNGSGDVSPVRTWQQQQEIPGQVRAQRPMVVEMQDPPSPNAATHQMMWGTQSPRGTPPPTGYGNAI